MPAPPAPYARRRRQRHAHITAEKARAIVRRGDPPDQPVPGQMEAWPEFREFRDSLKERTKSQQPG